MKFQIGWIECHDPFNWCDVEIEDEDKQYQNGIKNILDSLPNSKVTCECDDGWVEIECLDHFEADNIEKAKEKVLNEYDIPDGVFTVYDENDNILFIEEDLN